MFEFNDDIGDGFTVNCAEVVKSKESLAVTRLLAADLLAKPYLAVGDWIKNVSDSDLSVLVDGSEPDENDEYKLEDLMLIVMMLRQAEGLPPINTDEGFREGCGQLVTFLVMESLARKKLVRIFYENMSFGDDMKDKVIVEKL
jgi:hypothetical protein